MVVVDLTNLKRKLHCRSISVENSIDIPSIPHLLEGEVIIFMAIIAINTLNMVTNFSDALTKQF
jgi:hypothetical protein